MIRNDLDQLAPDLQGAPFSMVCDMWERVEADHGDKGRAWLGRNDRFYLLTCLLHRNDAVHPWLYARCREVEADPDGYLDLWSREHYKSTIITFAGIIQQIVRDPEITIGIFSHTKPVARKFLLQIKQELEANRELQAVYPDVFYAEPTKESPKWSEEKGIVVRRQSNPKEATVEAHGLVDGQPTGAHFKLRVYDDVVTRESVSTPDQVKKTTEAWELSDNLGARGEDGNMRAWHVGTRYCTVAGTTITMADWSQKRIEDVRIGDMVVGWELRGGKRWLKAVRVLDRGSHPLQPVNKYTLEGGRTVTCTADHKWWRGPHGSGAEYKSLALPGSGRRAKGIKPANGIGALRELMAPIDRDDSRDAAWLAGFYDGEGTFKKNPNHPSGTIVLTQTMHNPELIQKTRDVLTRLGFEYTEAWHQPEQKGWANRCNFGINGGWTERYRFLAAIAPTRREPIAVSLFGQLTTSKRKLAAVEDAGHADVFWLETETGNYVANGFCSKNSFADTYADIIEKQALKVRIYPATDNGLPDGKPVFLTQEAWVDKKLKQGPATIACQQLMNPAAGNEAMFKKEWLQFIDIRPSTLNVYIMVDPAHSKKKGSDNTAMAVIGIDAANNKYLLDGYRHKMGLKERWEALVGLRKVWLAQPGVQMVKVGYERYGMQADLEYFEEKMDAAKDAFEIHELNWTSDGAQAKDDRVQRLQPDFAAKKFYMAMLCQRKDDSGNVVPYETANQKKVREGGQAFRIFSPVRRKDHENNVYSLNKGFLDEYLTYPFSAKKDLIDATSRIYDMEPVPPVIIDERTLEPETFADGV